MASRSARSTATVGTPAELRPWVARRLLAWFDQHQRDLPWRANRDAYRIWVSEVMLQQTQVATVIPYFDRFLARFPTLAVLAAAEEQAVLRLWEGLGYYRRARDLHRAARVLVQAHAGRLPNDPAALAALPGFGRYTCNAVLSQAFDRRLPILEANSQRVLSRFFARTDDPRDSAARRWLWQAAEDLLPTKRVGAFNQALMELGALVCTPTAPACPACPLAKRCAARLQGRQEVIPPRASSPAPIEMQEVAIVIWRGEKILLAQRPADARRWAGLWEFPHGDVRPGETHAAAALRLAKELAGLTIRLGDALPTIRHGITQYKITMTCFEARRLRGEFKSSAYEQGRWVAPAEISGYPCSSPQRRLANAAVAAARRRGQDRSTHS